MWGFFTFQYFVFFLIFAFSCLSFSSFPLLLDFSKPKSGPSNEVIGKISIYIYMYMYMYMCVLQNQYILIKRRSLKHIPKKSSQEDSGNYSCKLLVCFGDYGFSPSLTHAFTFRSLRTWTLHAPWHPGRLQTWLSHRQPRSSPCCCAFLSLPAREQIPSCSSTRTAASSMPPT